VKKQNRAKMPFHQYNKNLKQTARKLRKEPTQSEKKLWNQALRNRQMMGYRFLRQRSILNYIVDFFSKELKLIIEVDGLSHDDEKAWQNDLKRQKELEANGFTVLRFRGNEVMEDLEDVKRRIAGRIENFEDENPKVAFSNREKLSRGGLNPP
jgi:very-short-patch-repair endonuclease